MTMTQTVITSETPVEKARDEQIGQVKGLLDPILRKLTKDQIQMIIHAGGVLQDRFRVVLSELLGKPVEKAIADGNFNYKAVDLPLEKFPMTEDPVESIKEVCFNEILTIRNVVERINRAGKKFASPLTALRYAAKYPGKQLHHTMLVVFEINGKFWYLLLTGSGSWRSLRVERWCLDSKWGQDCYFLVVDNDK